MQRGCRKELLQADCHELTGTATGAGSDGAYTWYCVHRASAIGLAPLDCPLPITRAGGTNPMQPERF